MVEKGEGVWQRGFLPFGRASIASGYTPATVPGRCPEPQPLKGRKERQCREKKNEKDIKFSTRMASEDREAIKELAKRSGMSMSDYVTACCWESRWWSLTD